MSPGAFVVHKVVYVCAAILVAALLAGLARRRSLGVALALGCFLFVGLVFSLGLADDSYISLRYARNFAAGSGLVFNVGERVEGYTCFLWVLVLGLVKKAVAATDLAGLAKALGIGFGCLSLLATYGFSAYLARTRPAEGRDVPSSDSPAVLLLLVATNFPLVFWSFSGMETSFYVTLLVGSSYFFVRYLDGGPARLKSLLYSSLLLGAAALTRPETYLVPLCNLVFILALEREKRGRAVALLLGPFLAVFLPYFLWRYDYYGHLFPNTYYAKVGGGSLALSLFGLKYLARGAIPHAILVAFVLVKIARARARLRPADLYLLSVLGLWVVTIVYTGADHFSELRYFVYLLPFMYLVACDEIADFARRSGQALSRLAGRRARHAIANGTIASLAIAGFLAVFYYNSLGITATVLCGKHLGDKWGLLGRWMEETSSRGDAIATPVVGAIGYYCDRPIIDMVGIVDGVIAHSPKGVPGEGPKDHGLYDTEYVLGRKPKYIYLLGTAPSEQMFLRRPDPIPAIQDLKRLFPNRDYEYGLIELEGNRFALYRRRAGS